MFAWTHGEKKGLEPVPINTAKNQGLLYGLLAQLQATAPKVVKFEIDRKPVLADVLNLQNQEVGEMLPQQAVLELKETVPLALNRAEQPISFDIVSLTRNIAEEQINLAPSQFGDSREAQGNEYDEDEGERDEEFE